MKSPKFALLLVTGMSLLGACNRSQSDAYQVRVRCVIADGRPVPGIELEGEDQLVTSDGQGLAQFVVNGNEGKDVTVRITKVPTEFELTDRQVERHVLLKKLGTTGNVVNYELRLRKKRESYVIMLSTEKAADLLVRANGAEVAQLNSRGAAAFLIEGEPRSELKVVLETNGNPRASEQNPGHTFVLPENSAVLAHRYPLIITPPPIVAIKKPPSRKISRQAAW